MWRWRRLLFHIQILFDLFDHYALAMWPDRARCLEPFIFNYIGMNNEVDTKHTTYLKGQDLNVKLVMWLITVIFFYLNFPILYPNLHLCPL